MGPCLPHHVDRTPWPGNPADCLRILQCSCWTSSICPVTDRTPWHGASGSATRPLSSPRRTRGSFHPGCTAVPGHLSRRYLNTALPARLLEMRQGRDGALEAAFQMQTLPSADPDARRLPWESQATQKTSLAWPWRPCIEGEQVCDCPKGRQGALRPWLLLHLVA
jgi:hypothetical protein